MIVQHVDGLPVRLVAPHDLGFLSRWGRVFAVLDQQDSGNLCFGVTGPSGRLFVKHAGARTLRHAGSPEEAITRLRAAAEVYEALAHPTLSRLLEVCQVGDGLALVFDWVDAVPLGRAYAQGHRVRELPLAERVAAVQQIYDFHVHAAALGWVAVDFYDGSVLVDLGTGRVTLCDLDFYRRAPASNWLGRMWGSTRFMSPEEFELGAVLDEVTNVFALGAIAHTFLGDDQTLARTAWTGADAQFAVAARALQPERSDRWPSISALAEAWRAAAREDSARSPQPTVRNEADFLRLACLNYSGSATEQLASVRQAADLLAADPSLAVGSAAALAACGEAGLLADLLASDPAAVSRETGPDGWPPLLYLCYARLDVGDPVATLAVLLAAGADPNSGFLWGGLPSPFTALTGVFGGGERQEPPHPQSVALGTMLLDAGADPNDNQTFYNRQFRPDDSHLLPLLDHGAGRPHPSVWRDRLGAAYPSPVQMVGEHLRTAAAQGFTARVRTLLEHGVDPNTRGYHPSLGDWTAYEMAVRNGHGEPAALLTDAGGSSGRLSEDDLLLGAALSGAPISSVGRAAATLVARRPDAMRLAGEQHGIAALARLLDLGYAVDAAGSDGRTALHEAALRGDREIVDWLLAHGADPTLQDRDFGATPAGWAAHAGHLDLAELLDPS